MRLSRILSVVMLSSVGALVPLAAGAQESGAPEIVGVGGGAFDLSLFAEAGEVVEGPFASVELPPTGGGPFEDGADLGEGTTTAVSTEGALGPDGFVASSAVFNAQGTLIESWCDADASGATGGARLDIPESPFEEFPEPNTEFVDGDTVYIVNEQIVTTEPDGTTAITVNAVHLYEYEDDVLVADLIYSQSRCSVTTSTPVPPTPEPPVAAPARIEPRFTG